MRREGAYRGERFPKWNGPFRSVQRAACTSYFRPELSSEEHNLTNATNGAVGNTRFSSQSGPIDQQKQLVALLVEARIVLCPIRRIRVIRSLMTRDRAPRGRVQGRAISKMEVVPSVQFNAPRARRTFVRSRRQRRTFDECHEWGSGQY